MSEALHPFVLANLAAAVAVVAVLALRLPARRLFGARIAYGLWLLVPMAALAMLLPARVETVRVPAMSEAAEPIMRAATTTPAAALAVAIDLGPLLLAIWLGGAALSLGWLAWRQAQFGRAMREGLAGPAVVGVLKPRIITPDDFDHRYTPRERFVVMAHEETHIARHDSRINALVAVARCVNWFNPLLYVLARCLRMDQELAVDAQVVAAHPNVRRSYAEAMLKTQLAARPLPLGCYWLPTQAHPLTARIRLLSRTTPHPREQLLGLMMLTTLALAAVGASWLAKPVQVQFVELPSRLAPPLPTTPPVLSHIRATEPAHLAPMSNRAASPVSPPPAPRLPAAPDTALAQALADTQSAPSLAPRHGGRWAYERGAEPRPQPQPRPEPQQRRILAAAGRSAVEPGSAIRLVASTTDAQGRALMTDLTSFGSQHYFRTGTFVASGSKERLFTAVVQRGQRLWVTASLSKAFDPSDTATIEMRPGETRSFTLPDGRKVVVTPTLRAETAAEQTGARGAFDTIAEDINRTSDDAWRTYRDRCRTQRC